MPARGWRVWPAAEGPAMYARQEPGLSRLTVAVDGGVLVLGHYSGGHTSIAFSHRFRWQHGRFELIGATSSVYERMGRRESFDYNLSTRRYHIELWDIHGGEQVLTERRSGQVAAPQVITLAEFELWSGQAPVEGDGGWF